MGGLLEVALDDGLGPTAHLWVVAEELALPPVKIHCSILAEDAIKAAVEDYRSKHPELAADKATGTHA